MNKSQVTHKFPILIMHGEYDSELAKELSKSWFSNQQGSKLTPISNTRHCSNMDNPEIFNKVVMDFLKENNF